MCSLPVTGQMESDFIHFLGPNFRRFGGGGWGGAFTVACDVGKMDVNPVRLDLRISADIP
jgi:hypothetical protein